MGARARRVQFMLCVFGIQTIILINDAQTNMETLVSNMSKVNEIMTVGGGEHEAWCYIFGMEYKPSRRRLQGISFGGSSEEMLEDFDIMTSTLTFTMVRFMAIMKFYIGTGWLVIGTVSKMALKTPNRLSVYVIYSLAVWAAAAALFVFHPDERGEWPNMPSMLIPKNGRPDDEKTLRDKRDGRCDPPQPFVECVLVVTFAFVLLSMLLGARYVRYIKTDKQVQPAPEDSKYAPAAAPGDETFKSATSETFKSAAAPAAAESDTVAKSTAK